jgi:hypothetical protein
MGENILSEISSPLSCINKQKLQTSSQCSLRKIEFLCLCECFSVYKAFIFSKKASLAHYLWKLSANAVLMYFYALFHIHLKLIAYVFFPFVIKSMYNLQQSFLCYRLEVFCFYEILKRSGENRLRIFDKVKF